MILDKIQNGNLYKNLSPEIAIALEQLATLDFTKIANGKHEIDGDNLFYLAQTYNTMPASKGLIEAHEKYIDIQFISSGTETIGYAPCDELAVKTPYAAENDAAFYEPNEKMTTLKLTTGMFAIFYPADAHMPGRQFECEQEVRKIVFKIKI